MVELLQELLKHFGINLGFLRILDYITFRTILAALTALLFELAFGHRLIVFFYRKRFRDTGGDFASIDTSSKRGTPTAGGFIFILGTVLACLVWGKLNNPHLWIVMAAFLYFGAVGFLDDYQKVRFRSGLSGLSEMGKTLLQLGFIVPYAAFFLSDLSPIPAAFRTKVFLPYLKTALFDAHPILFAAFMVFAFYSIVNAVNITDGLDGLVSGPAILSVALYGVLGYIVGNRVLAAYLLYPYLPGSGELAVFCGALAGGLFGFLWYNTYPAEVFMGDTGSLAIGGALATLAFQTRQELVFPIVGGVFVAMIASSLVQEKIGMKMGRRIFLRAPLHHSLTYQGIAEPKVVIRIWIISILLALLGALSIKLR